MKYRVVVRETGIGYKATLFKKFLFFWIPDTISECVSSYPYHKTIIEWQDRFSIPDENIIFKFQPK